MSTPMPTHHQRCPHTLIAHAIARCFLPPGSTLREHLVAIAECSRWIDFPGESVEHDDPTTAVRLQGSSWGPTNTPRSGPSAAEHIAQLFITDPFAPRNERVTAYSSNDRDSELDAGLAHVETYETSTAPEHDTTHAYSPPRSGGNLGPLSIFEHAPPDTAGAWTCSSTVKHGGLRALLRLSILQQPSINNPTVNNPTVNTPPIDHIDAHVRRLLVQHCAQRVIEGSLADELARRSAMRRLSPRDLALLPPLIRGLSRPSIARTLGLSVPSVRHRTMHVYAALNVHSRRELIEWWRSPRTHQHTIRSRAA